MIFEINIAYAILIYSMIFEINNAYAILIYNIIFLVNFRLIDLYIYI